MFVLDFDWKAWGEDNYGEWRWNSTNGSGNYGGVAKYPDGASGLFAANLLAQGVKLGGITKPRILTQNTSLGSTVAAQYAADHGFWFPWQQPYTDYFSGRLARVLFFANAEARSWFW